MRKNTIAVCFACLFLIIASPAYAWDVWTTSPWLAIITRFIGGVFVTVRPIEVWNEDGAVVRRIQSRHIPKDAAVIALDGEEASRLGLNAKEWKSLSLLYQAAPFDKSQSDFFFSDPSALPFIAQRIFTVLSQVDPGNYPYYQRRLSEFQTRLDSTVIVGRQLLRGYPLLDLGGGFSRMLTAAGCELVPVDRQLKAAWEKGEELELLEALLEDSLSKKIPVLIDASAPKKLREFLQDNNNIVFLGKPSLEQDLLLFFHDQYLLLWNRLVALRQLRDGKK
jgi:hypothetical protein